MKMNMNANTTGLIRTFVGVAMFCVMASGCLAEINGETIDGSKLVSRFPMSQPSSSPSAVPGTVEDVPCQQNTTVPRLTGIQVTKQVTAGTKGTLIVFLADDETGMEPLQELAVSIARTDDVDGPSISWSHDYRPLAKGTYELEFDVSPWQRSGEYFVRGVDVINRAGNRVDYEATYHGNGDYNLLPTYLVKHPSCIEKTPVPVARFMITGNY